MLPPPFATWADEGFHRLLLLLLLSFATWVDEGFHRLLLLLSFD